MVIILDHNRHIEFVYREYQYEAPVNMDTLKVLKRSFEILVVMRILLNLLYLPIDYLKLFSVLTGDIEKNLLDGFSVND